MRKIIIVIGILTSLISCQTKSNQFELINLNLSFEKAEEYETKSSKLWNYDKEKYDTSRDITFNAYLLNLNSSIKNNTREKIDNATISIKIKLEFKSKDITLELGKRSIFNGLQYSTWSENETITSSSIYIMNDNSDFNRTLFIHSPEKVTISFFISADNSVGLYINDLLLTERDITSEWKNLESELKN